MCRIDVSNDILKMLGSHFSYNEKPNKEKRFYKTVTDAQRVKNVWAMKNLTPERKNVFFQL